MTGVRVSVTCRVAWGHVAGAGWPGRGYAIFRNGERVTPVMLNPRAAWDAYRREMRDAE